MTAADLVAELEASPLDIPFGAPVTAAEHAVRAEHAVAVAETFPDALVPRDPAAHAAYAHHAARPTITGFAHYLADVHRRALTTFPDLAALCRSKEALDDVESAAAQTATPASHLEAHATAGARAGAAARRNYQLAIARQIADVPGHELGDAARRLLAADDLLARVAAERTRREDHARAELERVQAEQRDAARQTSRAVIERVRETERVAADARARAVEMTEQARHARADALIERLRAHRLRELRVGTGEAARLYAVDDLVKAAHGSSAEQLALYGAAIDAMERA